MKILREVYVSVDIEADGPIPGPHSMMSLGAAAFRPGRRLNEREPFKVNREVVSRFAENVETTSGAAGEPDTMRWWAEHPDAWKACRENMQDPKEAMTHSTNRVIASRGSSWPRTTV
jgi:hypothetical protein